MMEAVHHPRMPAESDSHERTLMCWPARPEIWGAHRRQAQLDYAEIARAIARFEPVTIVARPGQGAEAADLCGSDQVQRDHVPPAHVPPAGTGHGYGIDIVEIPIDDSWARDSGPIYVRDFTGRLVAGDFRFNGWGGKFRPYENDAALAERWCALREEPRCAHAMVLEGGAITVDGVGTLVTTQQCLLHPNRNPNLTRRQIEGHLNDGLGAERVIWLPYGLALDDDTDGHVDNVAAFVRPGLVLLQGCADQAEPDHDRLLINRRWIEGALDARDEPLKIVMVPTLPYLEIDGARVSVPYLNFYVCNGGVIVPVTGHRDDAAMLDVIGACFPGREVVPVPGAILARGGGGPHCITQQVPTHDVSGVPDLADLT